MIKLSFFINIRFNLKFEIYRFINHLCLIDLVVLKVVQDQDLALEVVQIKFLSQELAEEQVVRT